MEAPELIVLPKLERLTIVVGDGDTTRRPVGRSGNSTVKPSLGVACGMDGLVPVMLDMAELL